MNRPEYIKICGITSASDAQMVCKNISPDALGIIFYPPSPRNITVETLKKIFAQLQNTASSPILIAVVVNPTEEFLESIENFVDGFQFHGDETPEEIQEFKKNFPSKKIWKALSLQSEKDIKKISEYQHADMIVIDAFCGNQRGGGGKQIPENFLPLLAHQQEKFLIAGGVSINNYQDLLTTTGALGIDLSSSLEGERKGIKSEKKVIEFGEIIKK